jgi:AsmA-like C-terminal region
MKSGLAESADVEIDRGRAERPLKPLSKRWPVLVVAFCGAVLLIGAIGLSFAWPFTRQNVIQQLELATTSTVTIGAFHSTFFPHPGCVADTVMLKRGSSPENQAVMTVERLTIVGNLTGLITKHLALIRLQGAHAVFPTLGNGTSWTPTRSTVVVDKLMANNALVDFASSPQDEKPVRFVVHEFVGTHLAARQAMKFTARVQNPVPPGEVEAQGAFGPWKMDNLSATPLAGSYVFREANLGVFGGIHGVLSSNGKFQGTLEGISVEGETKTPEFQVQGSSHAVPLDTGFSAFVDPANGDLSLHDVIARVRQTTVQSRGSVARRQGKPGKTASIDLAVHDGRIQDLFLLFVSEKHSPLNGAVSLKARAVVPPGEAPFLKKLRMTGDFGIADASFSKPDTQQDLDKLSASARGKADEVDNPEDVVLDLRGHVVVNSGIATFSELSFRVPGAHAHLHGTFDLISEKIDLRGILSMDASLPKATSGVKSFLLRALNPFLKKNHRGGAKFPVRITGTYHKPEYRADPV